MENAETELVAAEDPMAALRGYLRALWRRRYLVIAIVAVALAVSAVVTTRQPKVYSATASMIIDLTAPRVLDNDVKDVVDNQAGSYWYNREYYETQHNVIMSRTVSARVVDKLGLQNDEAFLGVDKIADPKKRAEAAKAIDAAALLQSKIKVNPVKDSRVMAITVEDLDPQRAALFANEVADAYMAENLALKLRVTESASTWLEDRLGELEKKSKDSDLAVYDFKRKEDMISTSLEDRASMLSQRLVAYNSALTETRTRIAGLKARVQTISSLRTGTHDLHWAEAIPDASTPLLQELKLAFVRQRTECVELANRYLDDHPKLTSCREREHQTEQDLLSALGNLVKGAEAELAEAVAKEKNLTALYDAAKSEAFELNRKQIAFEQLKRDADNNQRLYDLVLKRLKDIELSGLLRTSNVRVLDHARPEPIPIRPDTRKNLILAFLFGLLLAGGTVFLLESLDNTLANQADVEQRLGLPFLGFVPKVEGTVSQRERDLQVAINPKSSVAECCRAIRTNLLFMSPDKPIRTLVVTSSGPEEGKSTTSISLGVVLAQSGQRVLLLDTDMRRPRLHRAFGVPNDVGVSSLVVGEGKLEDAVKSTEVPNLYLLPCGPIPPNPAELLHTQAFAELLDRLAGQYDRIILDSPPVNAVADAMVLSTRVQGVVVIAKAAKTVRAAAMRAVRSLQSVQARVLGVVLNDVDLGDPKYADDYASYRHYGRYYAETPAKEQASS